MVGCDQEALKGLYPNFGSQSWTRLLRRIKYHEVLSRWNKILPCTCQPAVTVAAEAAGTPKERCLQLRLEGDIPFSARDSILA